jgi:small-conductance mechanosensitive channel
MPARDTLVILALAWFLWRLIGNAAHSILARSAETGKAVDRTTVDALSKLGRVSVVILAALVILQTLGFSISGVLAFGGIGGIAMGFAAKDMLANFFGGLTIYLDRPFTVGEWIRSPTRTSGARWNTSAGAIPGARSARTRSTCRTRCSPTSWWPHPHDQPAHQGDHRHPLPGLDKMAPSSPT